MSEQITLDLTQTEKNAMTAIADAERAKLIPKNRLYIRKLHSRVQ